MKICWIGFLVSVVLAILPLCTGVTYWRGGSIKGTVQETFERGAWNVQSKGRFGEKSMSVVLNPSGSGRVLKVFYKKGSYSKIKHLRGTQFYATPTTPKQCMSLTYRVLFAPNFDFVKGGKLPGLFGGTFSCSGGNDADGCFSTRLMWRRRGDGEVYAYIPDNQADSFCARNDVHCNPDYGNSLGRGSWRFQLNKWQKIQQTVRLNKPGFQDGQLTVWVDNKKVIQLKNIVFRNSADVMVNGFFFSTFFGGSSQQWASTVDTNTYFRSFVLDTKGC